jgi:hypothetical protein
MQRYFEKCVEYLLHIIELVAKKLDYKKDITSYSAFSTSCSNHFFYLIKCYVWITKLERFFWNVIEIQHSKVIKLIVIPYTKK